MLSVAVNGTPTQVPFATGSCATWHDLLKIMQPNAATFERKVIHAPRVDKLEGTLSDLSNVSLGSHDKDTLTMDEMKERAQKHAPNAFREYGKLLCDLMTQSLYIVKNDTEIFHPEDPISDGSVLSGKVEVRDVECLERMDIYVKTMTGKTITLSVNSMLSVEELKSIVRRKEGICCEQQRLVFEGNQLEDKRVLMDYSITHGATVHLLCRLRGGMFHTTSSRDDFLAMGGSFVPTTVTVDVVGNGPVEVTIGQDDTDVDVLQRIILMCAEKRAGRRTKRQKV